METLYEGALDRCIISVSDAKREWKKGYCVFRKHTKNGSKMLEFYKDSHWSRSEPKAVCNLISDYTVQVSVNPTSKKRFTFELKSVEQTYELSAQTQMSRQKWIDELTKQAIAWKPELKFNIIRTFGVVLVNEDHVKRFFNSFSGVCKLVVTDAEVVLMVDGHHKVLWKFSTIRRYKSLVDTFILEVGRRAPTGEGEFHFKTDSPVELFDVLDKAVKDRMKAKGIEVNNVSTPELPKAPPLTLNTNTKPPTHKTDRYTLSTRTPNNDNKVFSPPLPSAQTPYFPKQEPENEYSHLGDVQPKSPTTTTQDSHYDMLFNRERLIKQRASEPNIMNGHPYTPNRVTGKLTTPSTSFDNDLEDQYEEMLAAVEKEKQGSQNKLRSSPERKPRPLPAPRVKPSLTSPKLDLRKSNSTPLAESTYDMPSKRENGIKNNIPPTEYDTLFKSNNNSAIIESEYSHLDHNGEEANRKKPNNIAEDFSNVPLPKPPLTNWRKVITKPNRPAPMPPPSSKNGAVRKGRPGLSASAGASTSELFLQLQKRNKDTNESQCGEEFYDSPDALPVGYNQVGEFIRGEYRRVNVPNNTNSMDSDGYVKVPESEQSEDIYQVPRE